MSISHRDKYVQNPLQLRASQRKLLSLLGRLDNRRGCFARRSTIAEMINYSIHTVNCDISKLKRSGFLSTDSSGQRRDSPSIIRLTPRGRAALIRMQPYDSSNHSRSSKNFAPEQLQGEYKQSMSHDKDYHVQKSGTKQQRTYPEVHEPHPKKHVVAKPVLSEKEKRTYNRLHYLGIGSKMSLKLAETFCSEDINRAENQAKRYRGKIWNYPGFIVSALNSGWGDKPRNGEPERKNDFPVPARQWAAETRQSLSGTKYHIPGPPKAGCSHDSAQVAKGDCRNGVVQDHRGAVKQGIMEVQPWKACMEDYEEPATTKVAKDTLAKIRGMFSDTK